MTDFVIMASVELTVCIELMINMAGLRITVSVELTAGVELLAGNRITTNVELTVGEGLMVNKASAGGTILGRILD